MNIELSSAILLVVLCPAIGIIFYCIQSKAKKMQEEAEYRNKFSSILKGYKNKVRQNTKKQWVLINERIIELYIQKYKTAEEKGELAGLLVLLNAKLISIIENKIVSNTP